MQTEARISRRAFLCGAGGLCAGALMGCAGTTRSASNPNAAAYYTAQLPVLMKDMDALGAYMRPLLMKAYDEGLAEAVDKEAREGFAVMAPALPYIGGKGNDLTEDLVQAAMALSFYQAMKSRGKSVDEAGRIVYETVAARLAAYPRILFRMGWVYRSSWFGRQRSRQAAAESQLRLYPGDWVSTYVDGDGMTFDWGIDYHECGNIKLCRALKLEEFAPYLCLPDQLVFEQAGAGLVRTQTLAAGAPRCDFRFKAGRHTQLLDPFSRECLEAWRQLSAL